MATAYCMKCRKKMEIKNPKSVTLKNQRPATEGVCPACGTIDSQPTKIPSAVPSNTNGISITPCGAKLATTRVGPTSGITIDMTAPIITPLAHIKMKGGIPKRKPRIITPRTLIELFRNINSANETGLAHSKGCKIPTNCRRMSVTAGNGKRYPTTNDSANRPLDKTRLIISALFIPENR